MMLGKELINIFTPGVVILFDVGAGELMKAALSQRVLCVGVVPNKAQKEMVMEVLRKFVDGLNLVNIIDGCPTKPFAMVRFESQNPDNEDVKKATASTSGLMLISRPVIQADGCGALVLTFLQISEGHQKHILCVTKNISEI